MAEARVLVDAHAHLDRYEGDLESALAELRQHRILTISNSMDLPSYERNVEIAERTELVLPIFGVHPWNAPEYADQLASLEDVIERSPMLGEIGLDHHFIEDESQYPAQKKVLAFLLSAAAEQGKVVTLHTKGAEREVLDMLVRAGIRRAIVHWYSGPLDVFQELVALGVHFTVGVEVMHSGHIRTIAREVPEDRLLTETDNPGGPRSLSGTLGMPRLIEDVVRALAELRGATYEDIVQTVAGNLACLAEGDAWLSDLRAMVLAG
jgi:TatD DNase family protein